MFRFTFSTRIRVHFLTSFLFIVVILRFPLTSCVFTCHLVISAYVFISRVHEPQAGKPTRHITQIHDVGYVGARRLSRTQWTIHRKHTDGDTFQMRLIIFE